MVICPKCKSNHVSRILYGMPTHEAFEMAERGELILGGCCIMPGQPDFGCLDCDYQWSHQTLDSDAIVKVRFKVWENGPGILEELQTWVYEIKADGKGREYVYKGSQRAYSEKYTVDITETGRKALFEELQKAMMLEDVIECEVCDGCSYQLQITYIDGRKETISGDVAGGTFDSIMLDFVNKVFDEEW